MGEAVKRAEFTRRLEDLASLLQTAADDADDARDMPITDIQENLEEYLSLLHDLALATVEP